MKSEQNNYRGDNYEIHYLLIRYLTLIATSCKGVSDITSLDSGSESSLSEEDDSSGEITSTSASTEGEIDYATLNDFFGFDIYSLIPKIYSNDYEFFDDSSVDFPIDIYIDLFDWSEADAVAYDESLAANLPVNEDYGYVLQENTYTRVYFYDDDFGNTVFYINLFTVNDGGTTPIDPGDFNCNAYINLWIPPTIVKFPMVLSTSILNTC